MNKSLDSNDRTRKGYPRAIENNYWYEIVIDDEQFISGESLIKLFQISQTTNDLKYIFCAGLDGAPKEEKYTFYKELLDLEYEMVNIEDIIKLLQSVKNLDWGDFYFFKNNSPTWEWSNEKNYPKLIKNSNLTIRVIDTNYYYIHTNSVDLRNEILKNYFWLIETVCLEKLENHLYPD